MDTSQYLSMFLEESMDNLQTLNETLLELEQNPDDIDKLNEIFRVAHTIKGMAATMGFSKMAELTHNMENILSKFRDGELTADQYVVTILFKCLDTLEQMVNNISEDAEDTTDIQTLIKELTALTSKDTKEEEQLVSSEIIELNEYDISVLKQASERGFNVFDIKIILDENTLLKSARAFLIFKSLEEAGGEIIKSNPSSEDIENENFEFEIEIVYITNRELNETLDLVNSNSEIKNVEVVEIDFNKEKVNDTETETKEKAKEEQKVIKTEEKEIVKEISKPVTNVLKENTPSHKKAHQSVRVDLERLDKFMNMVSELVIHRTRLEQISTNHRLTDLNETLEQVARTTSDLQDLVMKIRMLPLDIVFNRFPRMIRDLSLELGKEIDFVIEGQDTELDRTVIDEIGEPLIHLIRNAVDHGIEPTKEERVLNGKKPEGTIKLIAYQEGTKAVIKVQDDGKGINVEKVKAKAEKLGVNTEAMSYNEIVNLIFMQGFSTKEQVTDISGRGVGMDVVKTKIASLGGTVDLISESGKGSTFIITLPLTLQIIKALLVKVGEETLAISLGYIDRVIDFTPDLIKKTNNKEVLMYRDNVIPLIRVNEHLGINSGELEKSFVVIVKVGEKVVGLLVDSLLGQQEIVIKPLGKTLQGLKEYIGATILGDGLVTLILDVAALI
ncbi:chemotaxis protein CheA [Clostridium frigidicarnis]|uniref:Chemotaxis protein CheA n=1 Tax=Clostridium frigidicarnis TaxID=84698 RepID=A0A1I0ZCY9_9CLOT|nr:chemotaxis protein CheA [Clostridium frigidicarnis]SFB23237.1 two-component system, chemotaxis family, sensor kinase CheA [Clostridium frigidicarnis]